jgi:uncharacterized protein YicC (UPF0701 family)
MTSKKDPPKKPTDAPPAPSVDPLAGQPVEVLIEVLATAGGKMQGLEGAALKKHVAGALVQVQQVVSDIDAKVGEDNQRKAIAAQLTELVETMSQSRTPQGKAIEPHRAPIVQAFQSANLDQLTAGMAQLAEWMANPSPETEDQAKALLARLEKTMGPAFGIDPEAAEKARTEQMKADVKKSLDDIFRGKDFAETLRKKS